VAGKRPLLAARLLAIAEEWWEDIDPALYFEGIDFHALLNRQPARALNLLDHWIRDRLRMPQNNDKTFSAEHRLAQYDKYLNAPPDGVTPEEIRELEPDADAAAAWMAAVGRQKGTSN
jgi:hypothetical protein